MKKVLALILAVTMVFSLSVCFAEETVTEDVTETVTEEVAEETVTEEAAEETTEEAAEETSDVIKVTINGKAVEFDQQPILVNDRTLVPLRAIFEELGATVTWDNDTNTAHAFKGDIFVSVQIDNNILFKNNEQIELDVPAMLVNDRTLVPIRAISEAFECTVDWVEENNEVVITYEEEATEEVTEEVAEETTEETTEEATEEVAEETTEEVVEEVAEEVVE